MMALEAIKLITGAGEPLTGRLLIYDGLAGEARTVRIGRIRSVPIARDASALQHRGNHPVGRFVAIHPGSDIDDDLLAHFYAPLDRSRAHVWEQDNI